MKKLTLSCFLLLLACQAQPLSSGQGSTPSAAPSATASSTTVQNLIPNPDVETANTPALPADWSPDNWGENQASLSWAGGDSISGQKYLSVSIQDRTDGDAKWIFTPQKLEPGQWYEYSSKYRSDGRSRLVSLCQFEGGQRQFRTLWQSHESKDWETVRFRFYSDLYSKCEISILHLLDRKGYLQHDLHSLKIVPPAEFEQGLVSVTFDDIWSSAVNEGAAELESRGYTGSFYVTQDYAEKSALPEYAKANTLQKLIDAGHEIGAHSLSHRAMTKLTEADLQSEVQSPFDYLKANGQEPQGFAYPFGDFGQREENSVKKTYAYARTSLTGLNDKTADPYRIRIVAITRDTSTSQIFEWIDAAKKTKTWVVFLFHDLQLNPNDFDYTSTVTQYRQMLDYIQRNQVKVVTVKEGIAALKAQ